MHGHYILKERIKAFMRTNESNYSTTTLAILCYLFCLFLLFWSVILIVETVAKVSLTLQCSPSGEKYLSSGKPLLEYLSL